ncbi:MAG: type IV pilin N-terminal domain-containing protein [Halorhabdus sp.]
MRAYRQGVDRGVSPVIGVILMVAITVLLAAVVGAFVMNMDIPKDQPPSTSWDISKASGAIVITHDGGEAASAGELVAVVRYGGAKETLPFTMGSNSYSVGEELTASDSLAIVFSGGSSPVSDYVTASKQLTNVEQVQLVWKSSTGSRTQLLTTWEP